MDKSVKHKARLVWHLALLLAGLALVVNYNLSNGKESVRRPPTRAELAAVFGDDGGGVRREVPVPHYEGVVQRGNFRTRVAVVSTAELPPAVRGYVDEINLLVAVDETGTIATVKLLAHRETPAYMIKVLDSGFLSRLTGRNVVAGPGAIDTVTGASITARAIRDDVLAAAGLTAAQVYGLPAPAVALPSWTGALADPRLIAVMAALALALFARLSPWPKRGRRETAWAASLILIGIYAMTPYTLAHTFSLLRLDWPGPGNALLAVLACFVVITTVALGPVWCGYACPFGALQEFLALLPFRRWRVTPRLMRHARETRYLVLLLAAAGAFGFGVQACGHVEPFGPLFARTRDPAAWAFIACTLVASLFVRRFWCRFFCPTGACLVVLSSHRRFLRSVQRGLDDAGIDRPDREDENGCGPER